MNPTHDSAICGDLPLKKYGIPSSFTATASISRPWQRSRTAAEYNGHVKLKGRPTCPQRNVFLMTKMSKMSMNDFHQLTCMWMFFLSWYMYVHIYNHFIPGGTEQTEKFTLIANLLFILQSISCFTYGLFCPSRLSARTLTHEPAPEPGPGRGCERAASCWAVLWSSRDWRGLERQQSCWKGALAAAAETVYIMAQFTWATSHWVSKEEEQTICSHAGLIKDAHNVWWPQRALARSSHCSDNLPGEWVLGQ